MHSLNEYPLDPDTLRAIRDFIHRLKGIYPVRKAVLFGSRARGEFRSDSDADVAVFLDGAPGRFAETKLALADIAYDVLLETGIRVQPIPVWETEWAHPETYPNPRLLQNIEREGVAL